MSTLHDLRYRAKQYATGQLPAGSPTPKLPKKSAAAAAAVPVKSSLRGGRASAPTVDDHSKSTPPTSRSYTSAISQAGSAVAAVAAASQDESKAARGQTSTLSAGPYQMQQQPHTQQHTQSRSRTHSTAPSTAPSHQSNHPASTNPASRGTSNHSYQGEDDYYSGSEYSDSGCSTCSGSRHGDYSSASRTPSRSPSRSTRFTPASDHPQPYHRYTPQSHRTGTETFSDDHADCISCTSSCSCTSGCDSEDDQDPGEKRFHSSSAAAGGGGRGRGNSRRHSHGGAQSKSRSPNRAPSHAVSAAQSKYGSNVALQVNTQRNAAGSPLHYSDVDMILESPISRGGSGHAKAVAKEAMLLSTGDESARFAVMEEGDDSDQWKVSEETQAVPGMRRGSTISQSSAHAAGSNPDGRSSTAQRETAALERAQRETAALDRALRDEMHVAFMTPRDGERDDDMHGMTVAQRREIYEGALACITRAEKGFHTYVLSSEQARSAAENPDVYSTALLRKLLRYEPRRSTHASSLSGSSPLSNKRAPFSAASAASASVGSGNLAYYDLRVEEGGNAPARFKLSRAEQEEVERMRKMERERDLEGKSDLDATTVAGESPFMAAHYAQLLQSRKGLSLILSRKAGLLPIRRIRSLRLGILPAAREFLHAVKARMEELSLDEGEEWREECCVSVLMDSGIKSQHVHGASAAAGAASFTSAHDEHHQTCISQYDPALCPRVPSSFVKARTGQGVKVKREIRRNERKMGVRPAWGVNQPAQQQQANVEQHQPSLAASLNSSFLNHSATAPQISTAHHSPSFPSHHVSSQQWYILCTASPEEASQLLNALMVMKLMAGKRMERRRDQEEKRKKNERVVLPPTGSPLRKRSKLRHQDQSSRVDVLEPMELTEVLMNAARKVQTAEAQRPTPAAAASSTATATASATPSAQNSQRSFLKRKSVPTLPLPAPAAAPAPAAKARKPVRQPSLSPVERLSRNWQEAKVASKFAPVGSPQRAREKGIRPQEEDSEEERPIDTKTAHQAAAAAASSAAAAVAHEAKEIAPMEFTIEETHLEETDIDQTMVDTQPAQPSQAQQMSSTAIFVPTQFHATVPQPTSQVSAASQRSTRSTARSNTHSLTGVSNPTVTSHTPSTAPASVQEWLERKSMRAEALKRQQAEEAEEKRQAEERKKIESAEALRKWEERQEKLEKQKAEQAAKIKAEKQAKAAAKKEETATRKALCMAAYAKFLARSEENRLKHEQESKEKAAKTSLEERRKKRAARTKYEEWVRKKSDWFVGRIQSIRKRAAARKKQGTAGAVDEEDPDEEAALDWKWLEREVEQELREASEGSRRILKVAGKASDEKPDELYALGDQDRFTLDGRDREEYPPGQPRVAFSGLTESEIAEEKAKAAQRDANLLHQVMDDVDISLWQKLMNGLEQSRDRLQEVKTNDPSSPLGRALESTDRARVHASVRIASPTPLVSINSPVREPTVWNSRAPVRTVGLFQEQVQLGGAALNGGSYGSGSSIPPRPSPFSAAATASESLLRDRTQLRGLFSGPSPSPARQHEYSARPHAGTTYASQAAASSSPHVVLPSAARAPYAQWLTSEIHSVIAENEDRADSMAGSRSRLSTYDDDYDVPTMAQRYPVAAAAAASLHSPMETSLTSASAFSSSFLSSHTGNLAEVLRSGIKDVRLQ